MSSENVEINFRGGREWEYEYTFKEKHYRTFWSNRLNGNKQTNKQIKESIQISGFDKCVLKKAETTDVECKQESFKCVIIWYIMFMWLGAIKYALINWQCDIKVWAYKSFCLNRWKWWLIWLLEYI